MSNGDAQTDLERLWAGTFGDDYVERNTAAGAGRREFWQEVVDRIEPGNVLEVGCNIGGNLHWLAELLSTERVAGVDVNERALEALRERVPGIDVRAATGRSLPFEDDSFDLVFTSGVLIHQAPGQLEEMMGEIVRCSRRWVLCAEYFSEDEVEVRYHGKSGALFKRDYGGLYERLFEELALLDTGFLARADNPSWDDVTWWLFERRET